MLRSKVLFNELLCVGFILFSCGCSGEPAYDPDLVSVVGTVTLQGKPLESAIVTFIPNDGPPSAGITDASGKYELRFKNGKPGALLGVHRVQVSTDIEGTMDPANEKVPRKYNSNSELKKEVKPGANSIDLDL